MDSLFLWELGTRSSHLAKLVLAAQIAVVRKSIGGGTGRSSPCGLWVASRSCPTRGSMTPMVGGSRSAVRDHDLTATMTARCCTRSVTSPGGTSTRFGWEWRCGSTYVNIMGGEHPHLTIYWNADLYMRAEPTGSA